MSLVIFLYTFQNRTCSKGGSIENLLGFLGPCNSIPKMGRGEIKTRIFSGQIRNYANPIKIIRSNMWDFSWLYGCFQRWFYEHYSLPNRAAHPWSSNEILELILHLGDSLGNGLQLKPMSHWLTGAVLYWEASLCHTVFWQHEAVCSPLRHRIRI